MKLNFLNQLNQHTEQLSAQRHQLGDVHRQKGLDYLATIVAGSGNKAELKSSFEHLLKAIQHNRQDLDAHIGLTYLQLIVGDQQMALRYLQEALRLDPSNAELNSLLRDITIQNHQQDLPASHQTDIQDELEEKIKEYISELQKISSVSSFLELESHSIEVIQKKYKLIRSAYLDFNYKIQQVAKDIDTMSLNFLLEQLATALGQMRQNLKLAEDWSLLKNAMMSFSINIDHLMSHLSQEIDLDDLYDQCDRFADQIDHYETQGLNIKSLEILYRQLTSKVEGLSESLDELA